MTRTKKGGSMEQRFQTIWLGQSVDQLLFQLNRVPIFWVHGQSRPSSKFTQVSKISFSYSYDLPWVGFIKGKVTKTNKRPTKPNFFFFPLVSFFQKPLFKNWRTNLLQIFKDVDILWHYLGSKMILLYILVCIKISTCMYLYVLKL